MRRELGEYSLSCARTLGISLPITEEALKSTYRSLARVHHPDKGGDAETFKAISVAYKFLLENIDSASSSPRWRTTEDGTPISDLGKGLGSRTNGKTCEHCRGLGYSGGFNSYFNRELYLKCVFCDGHGEIEMFNPCLPKFKLGRQAAEKRKEEEKRDKW